MAAVVCALTPDEPARLDLEVRRLTDPALRGGEVADERYPVIAR
ncbi:hypothetical protein Q5530_04035 [Saccharothrix sp. BKS2]